MSERFFVMEYKGGAKGVPIFVDGLLKEFVDAPWNDLAPEAIDIYHTPDALHFPVKHQLFTADFCNTHSLFFASTELLNIIKAHGVNFLARPVNVLQGKKPTTKTYFLIRLLDRLFAMDVKLSDFQVSRDETGSIRYSAIDRSKHAIRRVYKLIINEKLLGGSKMFYCQEAFRIIVNDEIAKSLSVMQGVKLTECSKYVFPGAGTPIIDRG